MHTAGHVAVASTGNQMASETDQAESRALICRIIDQNAPGLTDLSHKIWQRPELGYEEHFAHDTISTFLESTRQFQVERCHAGFATAFRATYSGTEQHAETQSQSDGACPGSGRNVPNIAFLCEYDALPEVGHACGHNLIAEAGIAAGVGLQAAMAARPTLLRGTVTIIGTPAEEGGGGKVELLKAGSFDDVDAAIMVHPSNRHIVRPLKLAQNFVTVTYHGRAAHACRAPWDGQNALDAAVNAYAGLSVLRQQMMPTWRTHAIIADGGVVPHIVPERAVLEAFARAPSLGELRTLKAKVDAVFRAAALATGCTVDVQWSSEGPAYYANLVTNPTLADVFERHFSALGFADSKSTAFGGSTDMGNVSHVVPSLHPMLDIATTAKQHTRPFQAASNTPIAHERTLAAAKAMALTGLDLLLNAELLTEAKQELKTQLGEQV